MTPSGLRLVQTPGPATMPTVVLEALGRQSIDHRSAEFAELTHRVLGALAGVFATEDSIVLYAASGTGAWEAAFVNTLSPGDTVLVVENGYFAQKWAELAEDIGLDVRRLRMPWGRAVVADVIAEALSGDAGREVRAVCVVHGETSTGVIADVPAVRRVLDELGHRALLMVDAISSALVNDYRHDEWRVDVTICASQKGLMAPPGVGLNIVGERAREASRTATYPHHYWGWAETIQQNASGFFPRTPATNILFALDVATGLILDETVAGVLARHARLAAAARGAVAAWGLPLVAPGAAQSNGVTAFALPDGVDSDLIHDDVLDRYGVSLGRGLGLLKGSALRIGHLGATTESILFATLAATELGLRAAGVVREGGALQAAMDVLADGPGG